MGGNVQMKICLDIGCGMRKLGSNPAEEWIGIDSRPFPGVNHVLDIGKDTLPFEDNSVSEIRAIHVYEHLYPEQLFFSIDECWRVLEPKGKLHIEVPRAATPAYYLHPDHKIQFEVDTWGFFQVPSEGKDPHGYTNRYWHVTSALSPSFDQHIWVDMFPNKPGGSYNYVEVSV